MTPCGNTSVIIRQKSCRLNGFFADPIQLRFHFFCPLIDLIASCTALVSRLFLSPAF
jgi:hypothetical protein